MVQSIPLGLTLTNGHIFIKSLLLRFFVVCLGVCSNRIHEKHGRSLLVVVHDWNFEV